MGRATYYMVEMNYPHTTSAEREAFDEFYQRHINMLLTIPGFITAQRFVCSANVKAPFLALYRLVGPDVMTSDGYTKKAGRMSVEQEFRVKMTNWDRNLVLGPRGTSAPDLSVDMGTPFTLIDRLIDDAPPLPSNFTPLEIVGLDATIVERGACVGEIGSLTVREGWEVREWCPIHPVRSSDE